MDNRYKARYCPTCEEHDVPLTTQLVHTDCGTVIEEENTIDLEVQEDMYKLYLGAKSAGWFEWDEAPERRREVRD